MGCGSSLPSQSSSTPSLPSSSNGTIQREQTDLNDRQEHSESYSHVVESNQNSQVLSTPTHNAPLLISEDRIKSQIDSAIHYLKRLETTDNVVESSHVIETMLLAISVSFENDLPLERLIIITDFSIVFTQVVRWYRNRQPLTPSAHPQSHDPHSPRSSECQDITGNRPHNALESTGLLNMKRSCILLFSGFFEYQTLISELTQLETIELMLEELHAYTNRHSDADRSQILLTLFILSNCIYGEDPQDHNAICVRERYQQANAFEILMSFLNSNDNYLKTLSLVLIAFIVDDTQGGALAKSDDAISHLVRTLENAVHSPDHTIDFYVDREFYYYEILGVLDSLHQLVNNDSCKTQLVINGGAGVLVQILQDGFSANTDELLITIEILWKLTFGEGDCREVVKKNLLNADCVQVLLGLRSSPFRSLRVAGTGLLWRSGIVDLNKILFESRSFDFNLERYMYLSYRCNMMDHLLQIKEVMLRAGHKICESNAELDGNKISSMMRNIRKSTVVVLFISSKYKDDVICQTEAVYAQELLKPIVALIMEEDYRADGWVGKLLRQRKTFHVYSDDLMREQTPTIVGELGGQS